MNHSWSGTPYAERSREEMLSLKSDQWLIHLEDGCHVADHCLDCPLRQCRFEDREWFLLALRQARDWQMVRELEASGYDFEMIAQLWQRSVSTVKRAWSRLNEGPEEDRLSEAEIQALAPLARKYKWSNRGRHGNS